jgi:ketosteroid isomerase-like protein
MKKIYFPMILAMTIVTSCQMKTKTVSLDPVIAKAEVTKTLDSISYVLKAKDSKGFIAFLSEDGLFCGTDPTEMWDKATYAKNITQMLADTTMHSDMNIDKKEIRIENDGNSAIVILQFTPKWSKPIPVRNTMHLVKANNKWMVDFSSVALIPDNKDLAKLAAAVK